MSGQVKASAVSAAPKAQPKKRQGKMGPRKPATTQGVSTFKMGRRAVRDDGKRKVTMDPWVDSLVPTLLKQEDAFAASGTIEVNTNNTAGNVLMLITNPGNAGSVMSLTYWNTTAGTTLFTIPTLSQPGTSSGPMSGRAMKVGVDIVNNGKMLDMGGPVYVLKTSTKFGIPTSAFSLLTTTQLDALAAEIVAFPKKLMYNACDLTKPKRYVAAVRNQDRYESFRPWLGTLMTDQFQDVAVLDSTGGTNDAPMEFIWIYLPHTTTVANAFTIRARAAFYTRWPHDSIPGQSQKPIPTATASHINKARP